MKILSAAVLSLVLCSSAISALAQGPSEEDRQRFRAEVRNYKHEFLTRELDLTREQQRDFFPLYDEMENQIHKAQHEAMMMEHKINKSTTSVSDLEYEKATEAMVEVKSKEASIEGQYLPKFREVLSAKQLFKLKQAERKFTQELMKQHNRMREKQPRR